MRHLLLTLVLGFALTVFSTTSQAQDRPDLSGTWTFTEQVTQPGGGTGRQIASSRLVITQTPADVQIAGGALLQDTYTARYSLDGTETTSTANGVTIRGRAAWQGQTLVVTAHRTFAGPQGDVSVDVKETYSVTGNTLTLEKAESLEGTTNSGRFVYARGSVRAAIPASPPPIRRDGGPIPRTPDGKPDMSGYWTGNSRGGIFDAEPHAASFAVGGGPGIVIEPADGKIPYQEWALSERDRRGLEGIVQLQDPEPHCFLTGVPRHLYVMPYQIIQTPTRVLFQHEYVHGRRQIPIGSQPHLTSAIRLWNGDSRGRWEGDTLVVDVANFNGKTWLDMAGNFYSENARILERFSLTDANTIRYEATITDPTVYTRPWKVALNLERATDKGFEVLESACHEDNEDLVHTRRINEAGGNKGAGGKE